MKKLLVFSLLCIAVLGAQIMHVAAVPSPSAPAGLSQATLDAHIAVDTAHYGEVQVIPFDFTTDTATGDVFYFHIGQEHAGKNITYVHAEVVTAGTTGTLNVDIHNLTQADADILSTNLTIDTTPDTGSDQATAPAVIDAAEDDVALNDVIKIVVDGVHTTPAKGLIITIGFETP